MPDVTLTRQGPGHLVLTVDGAPHPLTFPPTGNLEDIVLAILAGTEYPVLRVPEWSPTTILDIGANVGATAVFFGLAYPGATIHCYEPSPSTFAFLETNTAWLPRVSRHPFGLFDEAGELPLYGGTVQCAQASVSLSVETRPDHIETIRLERVLDVIPDLEAPAILKLDTEGCEVPILDALGELRDAFDVVYVEWHSDRDRRRIDGLLGDRFSMWRSKATAVHRGTAAYLHRRVLDRYPALGQLEIPEVPRPLVPA